MCKRPINKHEPRQECLQFLQNDPLKVGQGEYEFPSLLSTSLQYRWEIRALLCKRLLARHLFSLIRTELLNIAALAKVLKNYFRSLIFFPLQTRDRCRAETTVLNKSKAEKGTVLMCLSRAAPYRLCPRWSKWAPAAEIPARPSKPFEARLKTQPSRTHVLFEIWSLISDFFFFFKPFPMWDFQINKLYRDFLYKNLCVPFHVNRKQ